MESLKTVKLKKTGKNFSSVDLGSLTELTDYGFVDKTGTTRRGKVFLKDALKMNGMEVSLGLMPGNFELPFQHSHKENQELYFFISGRGQMWIDSEVISVSEGSAVCVEPKGMRTLRNTSSAPLIYLVVQAKAGSLKQWTGDDGERKDDKVNWGQSA